MKKKDNTEDFFPSSIGKEEIKKIGNMTDFDLNQMQLKMIKVGGAANCVFGAVAVAVFRNQTSPSLLISWYAILCLFNVINIIFSFIFQFKNVTSERIPVWLNVYHYLTLPPVCIIWSVVGILFYSMDLQYQVYIILFLLGSLFGFSYGTMTDFTATVVSICGIVLPVVIFRTYSGIYSVFYGGNNPNMDFVMSATLFILGVFLIVACNAVYKRMRKSIILTYVNDFLNKKLDTTNKFLEKRVKERTAELEDSLKLVTYQATHDLLTDLPNQRLLMKDLQSAIEVANNNHMLAIASFTLNEIEKINDGLGHPAGNRVIKVIAERFKKFCDNTEMKLSHYTVTLSRKDVFIIIIDPIYNLDSLEKRVEILFSIVEKPVHIEGRSIKLTSSIGVSVYPNDAHEVKTLLMNSDAAMLRAKQRGGNSLAIYTAEINANISKQLEINSQLHDALKKQEFWLEYQPFIDLKTGMICGMEALVRWKSPTLGMVSPADFIPIAEMSGMIVPLGEWVLRTGCAQARKWHDQGFVPLKIAINVSAKQLLQKGILETLTKIIEESRINPSYLELELTESEAFRDEVIPIVKQLKKIGVGLSIDDFGTGFSGLTNLKLFSIDKLKIDRSFIIDVAINNDSKAIVSTTIALAKKTNIKVLAEGVETKEQLDLLLEYGCDMIQGYYFSKPIKDEAFTELLKNKKTIFEGRKISSIS